jgi:hypothetical protein
MTEVLRRDDWDGRLRQLGDWFVLAKGKRRARCAIQTHPLGWELRLLVEPGDELLQSEVCRTQEKVFATGDAWKEALLSKGWSAPK